MTNRNTIPALLLLITLLAAVTAPARSASEVKFTDTTLERTGGSYFLPAIGTLDAAGDSIEATIEFNALQLELRSVRGGLVASPQFTVDFGNPQRARAIIKSNSFSAGSGALFELELEPLAFQDSISYLTPLELKLSGAIVDANLQPGRIKIKNPIAIEFFEGLGLNVPNPFSWSTEFRFSIEAATKVKFKVFSSAGFSPGASKLADKYFDYSIKDSEGKTIDLPEDYSFGRGFYFLTLTPKRWELSSGAYILVMETSRGSYYKNFIYVK
ncbi:MAG: hypothetical protein ACM3U1_08145 [Chloroflexota bacterium]